MSLQLLDMTAKLKGFTVMRDKKKSFTASITLEASLVLPMFIFFFVNIMVLFNIIKVQSDMEAALHQTGSELSLMAFDLRFGEEVAGLSDGSGTGIDLIAGAAGTVLAREKIRDYLGEGIEKSCVTGGFNGINFMQSKVLLTGDNIDLVMDYKVHPIIPLIGFKDFPVEARYFGHAWTGYDSSFGLDTGEVTDEMVYVTEYGEVYHRNIDCVHLRLKVESVNTNDLKKLRNKDGKIYYPCEVCGANIGAGNVFITGYGERYHSSVNCSGLKRKIYTIPLSEVGGRRPCSSCG